MSFVNWGVVGSAKFAREHMAPAIHSAPGGTLRALATSSPEKAAPFRAINPNLEVHTSYEALLADPTIDAVYIPLPNSMHVEWTLKALKAGKHVLTEKPVAMTAPEIDTLIAARDEAGKLAAEAFMIVFHPQWQRVRKLIADGAIGKLVHVDGAFSFDNREDTTNIRNNAALGGGALRDIGVYVIGSTRFATGEEPQNVSARIRWESGFDAFTQINAEFETFTYSAFVSTRLHPRQQMNFHGEKGVLSVMTPFNAQVFGEARLVLQNNGLVSVEERFPTARQYELQVAAFNKSVLTGAPYPCTLEFTRGTQAMIDTILREQVPL